MDEAVVIKEQKAEGVGVPTGVSAAKRLRLGLRIALQGRPRELSCLRYQTGRPLRWYLDPRIQQKVPGVAGSTKQRSFLPPVEHARLFWAGHPNLMEAHWLDLQMDQVPMWYMMSWLERPLQRLGKDGQKDSAGRMARWALVETEREDAEGVREWFMRDCRDSVAMSQRTSFSRGRITLMSWALSRGWEWMLEATLQALLPTCPRQEGLLATLQDWISLDGYDSQLRRVHGIFAWSLAAAALQTGNLALVREHGPNLEYRGMTFPTLAECAGVGGSLEVLEWLIDWDRRGRSALFRLPNPTYLVARLSQEGHLPALQYLASHYSSECVDPIRSAGLERAVQGGQLGVAEFIHGLGAVRVPPHTLVQAAHSGPDSLPLIRYLHTKVQTQAPWPMIAQELLNESPIDTLVCLEYIMGAAAESASLAAAAAVPPQPGEQQAVLHAETICVAASPRTSCVRDDAMAYIARNATHEDWERALELARADPDPSALDVLEDTHRHRRPRY